MKRDMELIRKIVLAVEDHEHGYAPNPLKIEGYTSEQIEYHAYILVQGGLAEGSFTSDMRSSSPTAHIKNLTWEGHEFAASAREDSTWHKVKAQVKSQGKQLSSMPLDIIKALLVLTLKSEFGL